MTASCGSAPAATGSGTASTPARTGRIWRNTHFNSPDATGAAADTADPDGDRLPNLVEYGLGLQPLLADGAGALTSQWFDAAGARYLSLRVARDQQHSDLLYSVEASSDLFSWSAAGTAILADTPTLLHVRDLTPTDAAPGGRRFLRLRITLP